MEFFLVNLYNFYLEVFSIWVNWDITFFQWIYYIIHQGILYYFWFFYTFWFFTNNFLEAWLLINFYSFNYNIKFEYAIFLPFVVLFLLNILTYFVWRFFWRNIEKKQSNKLNYYIIFFHFFPIVWFLWNYIVWKNFKISFWKLLLKNSLFLIILLLLYFIFLINLSFLFHLMFLILIPILIWICSYFYYFYYFKFKK